MVAPRSLYVHVPFCERKCPYCAFNSVAGSGWERMVRYVDALEREIALLDPPLALETVYVGGGTPTALPADLLSRLMDALAGALLPGACPEWTVEVNPGAVSPAQVTVLRDAGANRISMGVQSLDPDRLRLLGRVHGPCEVAETIAAVREAGFRRLNLDLIYGQPGQSRESWLDDVDGVLAFAPDHLSLYALQFEPGTPFGQAHARGRFPAPDEEDVLAMFRAARLRLTAAGLRLYEISNFARPGSESEHNRRYWRNEPYLGIGAGAYACVGGERRRNEEDPDAYATLVLERGDAVVERDRLGPRETYVETLAAGLRTAEGVDLDALARRTGLDPRGLHAGHLAVLEREGWAWLEGGRLRLSTDGLWVLDAVLQPFLDGLPGPAPVSVP